MKTTGIVSLQTYKTSKTVSKYRYYEHHKTSRVTQCQNTDSGTNANSSSIC